MGIENVFNNNDEKLEQFSQDLQIYYKNIYNQLPEDKQNKLTNKYNDIISKKIKKRSKIQRILEIVSNKDKYDKINKKYEKKYK